MAATDRTIAVTLRTAPVGAGFDINGNVKTGKQLVHGRMTISSYTTGGMNLAAADLGLTTLDHISFNVVNANNGTAQTATNPFSAVWTGSKVIIVTNNTTQAEATAAQTAVVTFAASGDAAGNVELV